VAFLGFYPLKPEGALELLIPQAVLITIKGNHPMDNYRLLVDKLDQFIRKYYLNQFIRGTLYSAGLILVLFLLFTLMEYNFYFSIPIRKGLFYSFVGMSVLAVSYWMLIPLSHYFKLGKLITHAQAALIIGDHFADVKDKLLNILQLKEQAAGSLSSQELILASIQQKSDEIKPVPFKAAINLSHNRRYLRFALPPLLVLLVLLFAAPSVITESARRLLDNNVEFLRPAPFSFLVSEDSLRTAQFEDYTLMVLIEGDQYPNEVFIKIDDFQYRLTKESANRFSYKFVNLQKDTDFRLFSGDVNSRKYTLDVLEKPNMLGFRVTLDFPAYLKRPSETLQSIGDLAIPIGTTVSWVFNTQNTDQVGIRFGQSGVSEPATRSTDQQFSFKHRAMQDEPYSVFISNAQLPKPDSINYFLTVIPDLYPAIRADNFRDSTDFKLLFFAGDATDDHGISNLTFNYRLKRAGKNYEKLETVSLKKPGSKQVNFDYTFDLGKLQLTPGDEVSYYFEVFDNDGVKGPKSARTNLMLFAMPTVEEFRQMAESNNKEIKDELAKALAESKKLQEELRKMRDKMLQEKNLSWQNRKELEKMLERQKQLEKQIEKAQQAFQENLKNQPEFSKTEEKILDKQQKLQELFEDIMTDEMKSLMEQIEELMEQLEKENALEMMDNFQLNNQDLEKELDRLMELFKQLEVEKAMQETIEELQKLAEEQEKLAEQTEKQEKPSEQLEKEQQSINEKFEQIKDKLKDTEKKNESLERPKQLGDSDQDMKDIQKDLKDSKENLNQKQNSKASKSQKNASQKMKDSANKMAMDMKGGEMEQMQEDMKALRQLLENLVGLSFNQENLIKSFGQTPINTPKYVQLTQEQFRIKDDFRLVQDSLQALAKRVFQIESFITEKVSDINSNFRTTMADLEERRKPQAAEHQQRAMKNLNDLALMLSETMNQMQQQMASQMPGDQQCNNPGGQGRKPSDRITPGQQDLNEQMKQMKERLEKGGKGNSKEFAQMAAKQAALRKALREKQKELQERGKGDPGLQEAIDAMDKVETDLVNKKLTNETMRRQQDILTRLLEHDKAERERGMDEKREGQAASEKERKLPPSLEAYLKQREAEVDMYKTVSPALKPYYKQLVEEYLKTVKSK
jgi:hypothetical protein